jgi:uncharacterized protein (TIGR02217 family)
MFYELLFPESISVKSTSLIEFNTNIIETKNGREQRISNRTSAKMTYNIVRGIETKADLDYIMKLFRITKGSGIGFRFKDWLDYSANNQIVGIGNGIDKVFQLVKLYIIIVDEQSIVYSRKIIKPVEGTVNISINDIAVSNGISINYRNGQITFDSAPAEDDVVTAGFEFDVPVRFDSDILELSMNDLHSGELKNIKLVEIL